MAPSRMLHTFVSQAPSKTPEWPTMKALREQQEKIKAMSPATPTWCRWRQIPAEVWGPLPFGSHSQ